MLALLDEQLNVGIAGEVQERGRAGELDASIRSSLAPSITTRVVLQANMRTSSSRAMSNNSGIETRLAFDIQLFIILVAADSIPGRAPTSVGMCIGIFLSGGGMAGFPIGLTDSFVMRSLCTMSSPKKWKKIPTSNPMLAAAVA